VALAYVRAALAALDLAQDLARRAGRLADAAPKLRAKGKAGAIAALLADDAVSAAAPIAGLSDRARRRLFDRLVALGAARELTGRPTFRLYGL
jgi:Fic family protein